MGFFSSLLRIGIVRVSFVPVVMGLVLYGLYVLAAPPEDHDDDAQGHNT
jgi:hypothetical protein